MWDEFKKVKEAVVHIQKGVWVEEPCISIGKTGITFNKVMMRSFFQPDDFVEVLYDPELNRIGLRPSTTGCKLGSNSHSNPVHRLKVPGLTKVIPKGIFVGKYDKEEDLIVFDLNEEKEKE